MMIEKSHFENKIDSKYQSAKELYLNGASLTEIEKVTGFNRKRLSSLLKYEGYSVNKNNQKYSYNESAFEIIDTEQKAYWLGFLYADGCIRVIGTKSLSLVLSAKDKEHLEKFRDFISPENIIRDEITKLGSNEYSTVRLHVTNSKIVDDLIDKGCVPEKTFIIEFPQNIPQELIRHFIRGYFDGDGTTAKVNGKASIGLIGACEEFICTIERIFNKEARVSKRNIMLKQREGRSILYEFRYGSQVDIMKLYHYLYDNATVYLERKHSLIYERIYGPSCGNA